MCNALTVISHLNAVAASEWEGLQGLANPVEGLRRPKHRPGRDRRLEGPKEEARLLKGCNACGNATLRPVVLWALETAMRQGEILALNLLLRLEELTEEEMDHIKTTFTRLATASPPLTEEKGDQTT